MNNDKFLELTIKYLSNEASDSERDELNYLLNQSEYAKQFKMIRKEWKSRDDSELLKQFNTGDGLQKLNTKISKYDIRYYPQQKKFPAIKYVYRNVFVKTAISVALVLIISTIGLYYLGLFNGKTSAVAWNEKVTQVGEKSTLTFLDGTKIILNADSKLKYPSNFNSSQREVILEGEAFFEVAHMDDIPFIVHSGNLSTEVLGTKFNVNAYPNEKEIAVSLVEGKVKVSIENDGENLLSPNQQLTYNKVTTKEKVGTFDLMQVIGWKDNILIFDDVQLEKAFVVLERLYGVKFELADKELNSLTIRANFENASFWTIVKVIKSLTDLEYKAEYKNDELQKIIFYKK